MSKNHNIQHKQPHTEPEASTAAVTDFDEPAASTESEDELQVEDLRRLIIWFGSSKAAKFYGPAFAAKNLALLWTLCPELYDGKSQSAVAKEHGLSKKALSRYSANVSKVFGIKNGAQIRHGRRNSKAVDTKMGMSRPL